MTDYHVVDAVGNTSCDIGGPVLAAAMRAEMSLCWASMPEAVSRRQAPMFLTSMVHHVRAQALRTNFFVNASASSCLGSIDDGALRKQCPGADEK